ncbi:MAG: hypothetical protein AB8G99_17920 [Planctomycetaceae bacterium]
MRTSSYFDKAKSPFFKWGDHGNALLWDSGLTIAFAEEIVAIMRRTAKGRLPPFNTIAVLLSACRSNWPDARTFLENIVPNETVLQQTTWEALQLRDALVQLDRIHGFPKHLRTSLEARCELFAMVLKNQYSHWMETEANWLADQVEAGLAVDSRSMGGFTESTRERESGTASQSEIRSLISDILWLKDGLEHIDPEQLEKQLKTGLPGDILPDETNDDEPDVSTRELIASLIDDDELGGIARLARNLFAVVHFPKPLGKQEDLPLGGVSDITNRGQLDRLLISELAHDDLTLAVRVAVGEAMYLRRESPPKSRSTTRHVLLDSGLAMWGIPRIYGIATTLAMAATTNDTTTLVAWRGDGPNLHEMNLSSRESLIEQMHYLSSHVHAGPALDEFLTLTTTDDVAESVVVTSQEIAGSDEFSGQLQDARGSAPVFVLAVARDGSIDFTAYTDRGKKRIRSARMELDSILSPPARESVQDDSLDELPAIFSLDQFPLRFSHPPRTGALLDSDHGTIAVTKDGRVLLWEQKGLGAIQLSDQIGSGEVLWRGKCPLGQPMFVYGDQYSGELRIVRLQEDLSIDVTPITTGNHTEHVCGHDGTIFVSDGSSMHAFTAGTSESIGSVEIPKGYRFRNRCDSRFSASSRFLTNDADWAVVSLADSSPLFQRVPAPQDTKYLFHCVGYGPVARAGSGEVTRLWNQKVVAWADAPISVSADGHRLQAGRRLIDVPTLKLSNLPTGRDYASIEQPLRARIREMSGRNKFKAIGIHDEQLLLVTNKGQKLTVETRPQPRLKSLLGSHYSESLTSSVVRFEPTKSPAGTEYKLSVANFEDGSVAYLDSRFLLHLRSSNELIPEITIVLNDGPLSGWCEHGFPSKPTDQIASTSNAPSPRDSTAGSFGKAYFRLTGTDDHRVPVQAIEAFVRAIG